MRRGEYRRRPERRANPVAQYGRARQRRLRPEHARHHATLRASPSPSSAADTASCRGYSLEADRDGMPTRGPRMIQWLPASRRLTYVTAGPHVRVPSDKVRIARFVRVVTPAHPGHLDAAPGP